LHLSMVSGCPKLFSTSNSIWPCNKAIYNISVPQIDVAGAKR
jgi:hypothetical protein